ncbi:tetratricopeptide repeat protein [Pseudohaliea rubra]|uniref:TPR domain protein, putative component of TonB system n=1 Tax=Pseudohaliea rubra DSM 19751 TaxID=1265313 RepID=A0A095XWP7_9GAMM|nr:CDC27 family protein [Pseudohaliea rubra]KGE04081.1 TPR domain protein, putative component of TonB system [Pseudohaliea rubra DSM 19751]
MSKVNVIFRAGLLAVPVLALQVAVTEVQRASGVVQPFGSALAQEEKPEQETRRTPALRNKVYEKLAEAQAFAEEKQLSEAARVLDDMLKSSGKNELNSYELANVYNLYAFIHYSNEDYNKALQAYENVVSQPEIPLAMEINTRYTIAQLYFVQERWREGIAALKKWFAMSESPNANAYVLLSQGYYQLKDYDEALENIETAIAMYREKDKVPKEQWFNLARFLYMEKNQITDAQAMLEELLFFYPKKQYWVQLSYVYSERQNESRQLAAMETAYDQDMLEKDGEYRNLASLFLSQNVPYKAGKVLREGFEEEIVEDNSKSWELLAGAWRQAQEIDWAIPAMEKAAAKSDSGDLYARLGSIYLDGEQYEKAIESINKGLQRGGVKRPDNARLVLGMAYFNTNQYEKARDAFRAAGRDERSKQYARQWMKYMNSEIERQEKLAEG